MVRKTLVTLAACMVFALLLGIPDGTAGERKPLRIALLTKTLTNPYFVMNKDAFTAAVKAIHPEDTVSVFDCNQDFNRELAIVEDCITDEYDVIVLTPIDYNGSSASVQKIVDAGIPCLLLEATANMKIADVSVGNNDFQSGYLAMQGLANAMGGKGKIVCFDNSTNPVARIRVEGRKAYLQTHPGIEIVNIQDGSDATFTVDKLYDVMHNFLIADPDITGVWCFMDPNATAAVAAIKNAGLQGQIHVVGIDASDECCDLVRAGEMVGTSAQHVLTITRTLAEKMYELLETGTVAQPHVQIPSLFIDKSNVDTDWKHWADDQPVTVVKFD